MTRLLPEDWQVAAYEAAIRDDHDAMVAAIGELSTYGRGAMERALRSWMSCTETVLVALSIKSRSPVGFRVAADADGSTGRPVVDPVVAWASQLFKSHLSHDAETWDTLFSAVQDGDELTDAVYTTLRVLAENTVTANDQFTELATGEPGPMLRTARMARAHLN